MAEFKEGDHPRAADGKFGSGGGSSSPKLTPTEKTYISSYTGDDFLETNKKLRNGEPGDGSIKHIDAAINKATLPAGTKLYRGMDKEAAIKFLGTRDIRAGMEISDKAFMSTSRRRTNGYGSFGGVMFEIETGEGQHGLDVAGLTRNPSEEEVLLPRNTKFRVSSIVAPKKVGDPIRIKVSTVSGDDKSRNDAAPSLSNPLYTLDGGRMIKAAGVMIVTGRGGKALFLKRAATSRDCPGMWCFPGGEVEPGETPEQAAERETREEIGSAPYSNPVLWTRRIANNEVAGQVGQIENPALPPEDAVAVPGEMVDFTTFLATANSEFVPTLNDEHTAWTWASIEDPPEPLHPGVRVALARLTMDELGIARAMAAGDLASPQPYAGFWLFAIRITGTGLAYRLGRDEYCWRDPSIYLDPEFLARCNGLPVIWNHPGKDKTHLDSVEFRKRIVGTTFLPYIRGDEVWAIVKVYDDECLAWMTDDQVSTSPNVVFAETTENQTLKLSNGSNLLIEGKPALLDHIALCDQGVWDKGAAPAGVLINALTDDPPISTTLESIGMPDVNKPAADDAKALADKMDSVLSAVLGISSRVDSVVSRMDAVEEADKVRKDAEEKERSDRARRDSARKDRFGRRADGEAFKDWKGRHDADETAMCDSLKAEGDDEETAKRCAADARRDSEEAEKREDESFGEWAKEEGKEPNHRDDSAPVADPLLRLELDQIKRALQGRDGAEEADFAAAQSRADGVANAFNQRAPRALLGETLLNYRKRLVGDYKQHSADYKDIDVGPINDPAMLSIVEKRVYADAMVAATKPMGMAPGQMRMIKRVHPDTGHHITEFFGSESFIAAMKPPSSRVVDILRKA